MPHSHTIVAIATAAGAAGIGIVRLSGPRAHAIARALCGRRLRPRHAHHARFRDHEGTAIDDGIALLFAGPASYTGEDVVELQAHGSLPVLQQLLARCRELGAVDARPGEFSERACLNGRLDVAQAEAVADLVAAADLRAARAARRSLEGEFSNRVDTLAEALLAIRVQVEAMIDFADEPLDTLGGEALRERLDQALAQLQALLVAAQRGRRLRDGLHAVLVGPPNAGKSSLLNALAGSERAIVTEIPGTTRDLLHETLRIDGVELTLVDTAGLRADGDAIEREGMRRARAELARADLAVVVLDARDPDAGLRALDDGLEDVPDTIVLHNKCDLLPPQAPPAADALRVSALSGAGLEQLHARLRAAAAAIAPGEGAFSARARHVDALQRSAGACAEAGQALHAGQLDLAAEGLRLAHDALGEITGRTLPDDLLGHIFSTFCIGK